MGKQMQGDEQQRRARAKEARRAGTSPSEAGVTTGADGQRRHLGNEASHDEKMAGPGRGKQQPDVAANDMRPHSSREGGGGGGGVEPAPRRTNSGDVDPGQLDDDERRVFISIVDLERTSGAASIAEIAEAAGLPGEVAAPVVERLRDGHDLVQEVPDTGGADVGPRYRVKARV